MEQKRAAPRPYLIYDAVKQSGSERKNPLKSLTYAHAHTHVHTLTHTQEIPTEKNNEPSNVLLYIFFSSLLLSTQAKTSQISVRYSEG